MAAPAQGRTPSPRASRLRRRMRTVLGWLPWTPLGLWVSLGALLALRYLAHAEFDLVWLVTAHVAAGLCVMAPLVVLTAGVLIAARGFGEEPLERLSLETGEPGETGMRFPSLTWMPLLQVRAVWTEPPGVEVVPELRRGQQHERARAVDRGAFACVRRRFIVEDPFGLGRISFERTSPRVVDVLPRLGRLAVTPSLSALASGDDMPHPLGLDEGDRVELQRYVPGDPARHIHWKLYARTRQLMVRRPERSLTIARRVAAFMVAGPGDDASAAIARLSLARGLLGDDWTFGTDAHPDGTHRVDEAMAWLLASVGDRDRGGAALGDFMVGAGRLGPVSLVLFAPPTEGPWIDRVTQAVGRARVRVLIGTDGVSQVAPVPWWRRALLRPSGEAQATPEAQLQRVTRRLRAGGCTVVVLDRASGRALSEAHARALSGAPGIAA